MTNVEGERANGGGQLGVLAEDSELRLALRRGDADGARRLIAEARLRGEDVWSRPDPKLRTLLGEAIAAESMEAFEALLDEGAKISHTVGEYSEFADAASSSSLEFVKKLWNSMGRRKGLRELEISLPLSALPLVLEDRAEDVAEMTKFLLEAGFSPNAIGGGGRTPLHCAVGDLEATKLLVAAGADLEAKTWEGDVPLMHAAAADSYEVVEFLLACGANPNGSDVRGSSRCGSELHMALFLGNEASARILLSYGATMGDCETGVLDAAAAAGLIGLIKDLSQDRMRKEGGLTDSLRSELGVALAAAAECGRSEAIGVLLEMGADEGFANKEGKTAAIIAAERGDVETLAALAKGGADVGGEDVRAAASGGAAAFLDSEKLRAKIGLKRDGSMKKAKL